MEPNEKVVKHLEMILGVIDRMARNSFMLKAWTVTLMAASVWLVARTESAGICTVMLMVVVVNLAFWGLDGYFLRQERLFRKLYDRIRQSYDTDFSMDTRHFSGDVPDVWNTCVAPSSPNTLLRFYAPLLGVAVILLISL